MIATITILTCLLFSVIYPLTFWISYDKPLKDGYHKFHIGLPCLTGGILTFFSWSMNVPNGLKVALFVWFCSLFIITFKSWKKDTPNLIAITVTSIFGLIVYGWFHFNLVSFAIDDVLCWILSGFHFVFP